MKRLSVFTVLALLLCFGFAQAQQSVSLDTVSTLFSPTELGTHAGNDVIFSLRATNIGQDHYNPANGFVISSPDGLTWEPLVGKNDPPNQNCHWGSGLGGQFVQTFINVFGGTGADADTVGYGGVSFDPGAGLPAGWDDISFIINVGPIGDDMEGKTICIDTAFYPPGGTWKWAALTSGGTGDVLPGWDGPHCFTMFVIPDLPPDMNQTPANYSFSHCETGTIQFSGFDVDGCGGVMGTEILEYYIVSGPGSIDGPTGVWSWSGPTVPQSGTPTLVVGVRDICGGTDNGATVTTNLTVTNAEGPVFDLGCGALLSISSGTQTFHQVNADDACGDDVSYSITDDAGITGALTVDANGLIDYTPVDADAGGINTITITATDGENTATCEVSFNVSIGSFYQVAIDFVDQAFQGQVWDVCINLVQAANGIGGYDFLIAYDASAMSFQDAVGGTVFDDAVDGGCEWEYFNYRYGANGNCSGGCPSGLLRVVGIAETNNGGHSPIAGCGAGETLACLSFLVSNDRTLECQFAPIRFFWADCGDNTISDEAGTMLYAEARVFDFAGVDAWFLETEVQGADPVFPTFSGTENSCFDGMEGKEAPDENVDFQNGGIMIACAHLIDDRGDLNLNGLAYEIADAVMYTNYFITGMDAFGPAGSEQVQGAIAASDTNADGIALSVADLVYLIRVVIGDALPYPKTNPVAANYTDDNGFVAVSSEMGAAHIVLAGDQTPVLTADGMDMSYAFDGENTRVLVYSIGANNTFTGAFIEANNVISVEFATYDGAPVAAKNVPTNFSLAQNYPNPFNPTAMISFALPTASNWTLTFYNVTGQVVETVDGFNEASTVVYEWNASELASGIYFYKLEAGSYSATKKAVLLK